ncbi:helix-turn-helix domain-containing protein [Nocardia sp. NPDC003482]
MNYVDTKLRVKFGKRLRAIRHDRELSQEDLAERANLHRTYISAIERGGQSVSLDNMAKLARALNVTLSELLDKIEK